MPCLLGAAASSHTARAQEAAGAAAAGEAKHLFAEGSTLYLAKRYESALAALERSFDLVPSPNSQLVIARCLRELGRPVQAAQAFASAEAEARRRAAAGAPRYAQTADSAAAEGAAVRAGLGTIRVRIDGTDHDVRLEVDRVGVEVGSDGEALVWHVPGEARISMRTPSGREQNQVVTVLAGTEVKVGFTPEPAAPPPRGAAVSPPAAGPPGPVPPLAAPLARSAPEPPVAAPASAGAASWARPAAWAAGAVTLAGAGLFVGFGLSSRAKFQDLQARCGPHCGGSDRPEAQAGKTEQTVANIALTVGSVAAAGTAVLVAIAVSRPGAPQRVTSVRWELLAGGAMWGIRGLFP